MKLLLGIDYGTGGCKVTVIDEEGNFVGEASTEFTTYHDHPGWSEQEPSDWWAALLASLKKLAAKGVDLSRVAALALDGSTHNAVLLHHATAESRAPGDCATAESRAPAGGRLSESSSKSVGGRLSESSSKSAGGRLSESSRYSPVRRTIMWTDQRATAECDYLRTARCPDGRTWAEYLFEHCYQMPAPTWTLPQLMWLKAHEPEALAKTEKVLFVKDYVRYLLTGDAATDYIEAQGTLMFGLKGKRKEERGKSGEDCAADWAWDGELVGLAGLGTSAMPKIIRPTDVVGSLTAEAAAATGLPADCKVVCGTSDSAVEDYGAGAVEPGDLIIKLATAGNVNSMTAEAHPHPKTLTYSHVVPGMWYSVSATNAAALCQRWWRDAFYSCATAESRAPGECATAESRAPGECATAESRAPGECATAESRAPGECATAESRAPDGGTTLRVVRDVSGGATVPVAQDVWALINAEAESSPVGANGVLFHPYLQGERCPYWDADLRASFTGVSISSTRGDFARALMEGVAFSLKDCYRTLEEMALPVKRIFLIGGGARSKLWSEIVANVFDCTVAVPSPADASFGSCLLAGVGLGVFPDAKAAVAKCLKIDREIAPAPAAAAAYAKLFTDYRRVHDALAPVYAKRKES